VTVTPGGGPTNADQCKNGGYTQFADPRTGQPFRNQGQCVSFAQHQHGDVDDDEHED